MLYIVIFHIGNYYLFTCCTISIFATIYYANIICISYYYTFSFTC